MHRNLNDEDTTLVEQNLDQPEDYPVLEYFGNPEDGPSDDEEIDEEIDDGFIDELNAALAEAVAATAEEHALKAARKRLTKVIKSNHPDAELERMELVATIRRLEEGRVWLTVGSVALFKAQTCVNCQSTSKFFMGWYTEQKHTSDPNARRLVSGKPIEPLPERVEEHNEGECEVCVNCVETQIAVDVSVGRAVEGLI